MSSFSANRLKLRLALANSVFMFNQKKPKKVTLVKPDQEKSLIRTHLSKYE